MKISRSNRMHDRNSFYKYVSAEVAKAILKNKTLRWSSPALFDDPYDVTRELAADIKPSQVEECIIDRLTILFNSDEELPLGMNPQLRFLLEALRKSGRNDVKEEIINMLHDSKNGLTTQSSALSELREVWKNMLPDFRILCFSANNNIASMWKRYADNYKGAVIEFVCIEELDTPWLIAKPVFYENRPTLLDKAGWGRLLILNQEEAAKYIFNESCYTKTTDWSDQEEWRVVSFKRTGENGEYSDYKFNPKELSAIYLGPEIAVNDRESILALLKSELSHVNVYFGQIENDRYIKFKEASNILTF